MTEKASKIMETKIKVSVIIPVYNTAMFLPKCIESVLSQTLDALEIIIVNDGSTDDSAAVIRGYAGQDKRILFIDNQENSGFPGVPRNTGLRHARGEYIAFVDSDDWLKPAMYSEMYTMAKAENLDMVVSDFAAYYGKNIVVYKVEQLDSTRIHDCHSTPEILLMLPAIWNKLFKRELLDGLEIKKIKRAEDLLFFWEVMIRTRRLKRIDKAFYCYRYQSKKSLFECKSKGHFDIFTHFDLLKKILEENHLHGLFPVYDVHRFNTMMYEMQNISVISKHSFFIRAAEESRSIVETNLKSIKKSRQRLFNMLKKRQYLRFLLFSFLDFLEEYFNVLKLSGREKQNNTP